MNRREGSFTNRFEGSLMNRRDGSLMNWPVGFAGTSGAAAGLER